MEERLPVGKIAKNSLKECVFFVNSALKIQCHIVKNTLLQMAFSGIFPTGLVVKFFQPRLMTGRDG